MLLLVICCGFGGFAQAEESALRAEIDALKAEVALLRDQLESCGDTTQLSDKKDSDVLGLMRKLAAQQNQNAYLAVGLGARPLILPEALLQSFVPNSYIVLLEPDAEGPRNAAEVATLYGVSETQIEHVYTRALSGFSAQLNDAERNALNARSGIAGIVRNGRVFSTGGLAKPRDLQPVQSPLHKVAAPENPINVYLFDTGIRSAHRDLQGRVADTGFSFFDNGIAGEDCAGHGTHVAARIAGNRLGISASAQLTSVKVIDRFGTGDVATVIAGIDWVMAQSAELKLVNMSLTRMVVQDPNPLDMAVDALIDSGAIVVVAAGNGAADVVDFTPARVARAITVGSSIGAKLSDFSNAGVGVDIYAPGEDVMSASIRDICGVHEMSGTSMAAPFVTGIVADMLSAGVKSDEIVAQLRARALRFSTGAFSGEIERFTLEADPTSHDILCALPSDRDVLR